MKRISKKLLLNQFINFFWTIISFTPVIIYAFTAGPVWTIYFFIVISILSGLLPKYIFDHIQLSRDPQFYEKLGVKKIRKFVQDGDIVNRSMRTSLTHHRIITNRNSVVKYLKTVEMYERYHFMCLTFFSLISLHAFFHSQLKLGILITACNFLYNVCPILLQQFNKARVLQITGNIQSR